MATIFAQGDILLERVDDLPSADKPVAPAEDGALILAEGEFTGHCHSIREDAAMYRDESLARDVPPDLYIGHVVVNAPSAELVHQEHAAITLLKGVYRVRRQRQLEPRDARIVAD